MTWSDIHLLGNPTIAIWASNRRKTINTESIRTQSIPMCMFIVIDRWIKFISTRSSTSHSHSIKRVIRPMNHMLYMLPNLPRFPNENRLVNRLGRAAPKDLQKTLLDSWRPRCVGMGWQLGENSLSIWYIATNRRYIYKIIKEKWHNRGERKGETS